MEKNKTRPDSDCYYYYYSSCSKGNSCPYRHEPAALKNESVCSYWLKGKCAQSHCSFKHMYLKKDRSKIACFHESQPSGCERPNCPFLHKSGSLKITTNAPKSESSSFGSRKCFEGKSKISSGHYNGKTTHRGAKSLQNLTGKPIFSSSDRHQTLYDLTGPNLAKCLSEFDCYEATLLTLFRNYKFQPEFVEQLISVNNLSFELEGEVVYLKPQVNICLSHLKVVGCQYSHTCYGIHMCLKYLIGDCLDKDCIYGHQWHTNHNDKILKEFNLTRLSADKLTHLFKTVIIPNSTFRKLKICKNYNEGSCQNEDCPFLHLCVRFLAQKCPSDGVCKLSHNIHDNKVEFVLNLYGISTNNSTKDVLLKIINIPSVRHSLKSLDEEYSVKTEDYNVDSSKNSDPNKVNTDVEFLKTKWAYDLDGDIKINEICFDSVVGLCSYEESGCDKLHCAYHFYWQVKDQVGNKITWNNFSDKQALSLEKDFCNPSILTTKLPVLDPSSSKKGLLVVLRGRSLWEADFRKMKISLVGGNETLEIRRLCSKACLFKWYFLDIHKNWIEYGCKDSTGGQQNFSSINSAYIEKVYNSKAASVDFQVGSCKYSLVFKDMLQTNLQTGIVRKVRRCPVLLLKDDDSETDLPSNWEPMNIEERCRRVTLQTSSEEYKKIHSLIQTQANGNIYKVFKIERIQNPFSYKAFLIKVQQMKAIYKNDAVIDIQQLFHGTGPDIVPKICDENFDWRLHGTTSGEAYGRGTYFAKHSSYSYKYAKADANGYRFMFVAKVAVGTKTHGNTGIARPPINTQYNLPYDSTVDNVSNPSIIVKYEKQEYYPEYLVTMI